MIGDAGESLSALFNNLLPLAGGKRGDPIPFNPVNVIHDALALFETHGIASEVVNPEMLDTVYGYKADLSTALVNLIGNSIHWLEQSRADQPKVTITLEEMPDSIIISVADNGPGIRDEFAESLFDAGFTTKDGGTGLGLNIAREALARSHAVIDYDNEFDGGARFLIRFPARKSVNE